MNNILSVLIREDGTERVITPQIMYETVNFIINEPEIRLRRFL